MWVVGGDVIGRVLLRDQIREASRGVLAALRRAGITTVMLTGDRRQTAEAVAREIGLDEVKAGLTPGQKVEARIVFPSYLRRLRDAIFADKRSDVATRARDVVLLVRDEGAGLDDTRKKEARAVLDRMAERFGYCDNCAADTASMLLRKRYNDLIVT